MNPHTNPAPGADEIADEFRDDVERELREYGVEMS